MAKRKTKMISIRVSESEYDLVKSHYAAMGGRSVSAFAREALQVVMRRPAHEKSDRESESDRETQVRQLTDKLNTLQGEVTMLTRLVSERLSPKG
jgi:uncharacterized protein (DUF1778 family)